MAYWKYGFAIVALAVCGCGRPEPIALTPPVAAVSQLVSLYGDWTYIPLGDKGDSGFLHLDPSGTFVSELHQASKADVKVEGIFSITKQQVVLPRGKAETSVVRLTTNTYNGKPVQPATLTVLFLDPDTGELTDLLAPRYRRSQ